MGKNKAPKRDFDTRYNSYFKGISVHQRSNELLTKPSNDYKLSTKLAKNLNKKHQKMKIKKLLEKGIDVVQDSLSDSMSHLNMSSLNESDAAKLNIEPDDTVVKYFYDVNNLNDVYNKENVNPSKSEPKKERKLKVDSNSVKDSAILKDKTTSNRSENNNLNNKETSKLVHPNTLLHELIKNVSKSNHGETKPKSTNKNECITVLQDRKLNGNNNNNNNSKDKDAKTSTENKKDKLLPNLTDLNLSYLEELKADIERQLQADKKFKVRKSYVPEPDMNKSIEQYGNNYYAPKKDVKSKLRPIYIDGSNVALGFTQGRYFSVTALKICIDYFLKRGHEVHAFVPHFRKYNCSNPILFNELMKNGLIITTPSRYINGRKVTPYDDRYIVKCAAVNKGIIVSCDNYRDLIQENPNLKPVIEQRLLMPLWVNDMLIFPDDPLGRNGPTLEQFLRF